MVNVLKGLACVALLACSALPQNVWGFIDPVSSAAIAKFALQQAGTLLKTYKDKLMASFMCSRDGKGVELLEMIENYFGRQQTDQKTMDHFPKFPEEEYSRNYWVSESFEAMHYWDESTIVHRIMVGNTKMARSSLARTKLTSEEKRTLNLEESVDSDAYRRNERSDRIRYENALMQKKLLDDGVRPEQIPGRDALATVLPTETLINIDAFLSVIIKGASTKDLSCERSLRSSGEYRTGNLERLRNTVHRFLLKRAKTK